MRRKRKGGECIYAEMRQEKEEEQREERGGGGGERSESYELYNEPLTDTVCVYANLKRKKIEV